MSIIDLLKKNEKPFGLMSEEMKKKMWELDTEDLQVYQIGRWLDLRQPLDRIQDMLRYTYRLRPDYAEKPEKIEVRIIRGDGYISPVSTSSISAHVKEFDGKKWVSVVALNEAVKSIANAEYWLKKLNVWGDSNVVQKIYKLVGLTKDGAEEEADYADEPEIEECEIKPQGDHWHYRDGGTWFSLHEAVDRQGLLGFKFDGYSDLFNEAVMYEWNGKLYREVQPDWVLSGKAKVLHASHVLMRRQT